jgi:hypothetical protein
MLDLVLHLMCFAQSVQNLCPALKAGQFEPEDGLQLYMGSVVDTLTNSTIARSSASVQLCRFTGDFVSRNLNRLGEVQTLGFGI